MISITPTMIVAAGAGILIIALGTGLKVQSTRLDSCKAEFSQFKAEVEVLGRQAEIEARQIEARDKERKEKADAAYAKTKRERDAMYSAYRSLRDQRTSESSLPAAAAGSGSPNRACFDRAAVDRGMAEIDRQLLDGSEAIIRRGDDSRIALDAAKRWAHGE